MKAKFFVLDFINYAFLLFISIFVFFYFLQGNRLSNLSDIFAELSKFSLFGILFLIFFKKNAKKITGLRDREKNTGYYEIIKYLYKKDEIRDWIFLTLLPIVVLSIAYFFDSINKADIVQAFMVFYIMTITHKFFFKKKNIEDRNFLTNSDKMVDEIVVYSLPMITYGIAIMFKTTNDIDLAQALVVLLMSYVWHKYYFKAER
jgi:hypothetical protein